MRHNKLYSLVLVAMMAIAAVSCKKDDEDTTLPSLSGTYTFSVPTFVKPGATITMTPRGLAHPEGKEIGYSWKVTPTMVKYDTTRFENGLDKAGLPSDGSFTHTFSDTLKTYTVYTNAFASGYTSSSATKYSTVVSGGVDESITGLGITESTPSVTIDGKKYYYAAVGDTDWLKTNVADSRFGAPYVNCKAMDEVFGRYYTYEEAMKVCPEGWSLPTEEDWLALAKAAGASDETEIYSDIKGVAAALMANASFNGERMWEYWPQVGDITDKCGVSIISAGYAMLGKKAENVQEDENLDYSYPQASFTGYQKYAAFWTADTVADEEGMAYYRYIISDQPDLMIAKGDMNSFGASVRCVRKK